MITAANQRWRDRRDSYRPSGETISTREYEVALIWEDTTPKAFVEKHHYSGSYPAARFRFGLYRKGALEGVAVFSQPMNDLALRPLPGSPGLSVELGRFVLLDQVPANGETWFLGRCFEQLRALGLVGVVSFSDPVARSSSAGNVVFGGHVGTIYQAHNAVYLGRGTARTLRLLPDGSVFSDRAAQKIRKRERGWRYAVEQLVKAGAAPPPSDLAPTLAAWLAGALAAVGRKLRHPGNHKYVWAIDKRARKALPASLPYPKIGGLR